MNAALYKKDLKAMLKTFLEGKDQSSEFASQIEGFLIEHFYEDQEFQELLEALAAYSPNGGDFLYDKEALSNVMKASLISLSEQNENG